MPFSHINFLCIWLINMECLMYFFVFFKVCIRNVFFEEKIFAPEALFEAQYTERKTEFISASFRVNTKHIKIHHYVKKLNLHWFWTQDHMYTWAIFSATCMYKNLREFRESVPSGFTNLVSKFAGILERLFIVMKTSRRKICALQIKPSRNV